MVMRPVTTMVGTVGGDPVLKFTQSGKAWVTFRIAYTPRVRDGEDWKDGETTWIGVQAWQRLAENVAESVTKGTRVVVAGRIEMRTWEKDGQKRNDYSIVADEIGLALSNASATVQRNSSNGNGSGQKKTDPWEEESPGIAPF